MNTREKILAGAVGVIVLGAGAFLLKDRLGGLFTSKINRIAALKKDIRSMQLINAEGMLASERMVNYEERSLPADREQARSLYQQWLYSVADDEIGMRNVIIKPGNESSKQGVYTSHAFTLASEGNLEQLTQFLYRFYHIDCLHRIRSMRVQPIKDSKNLRLIFSIEALAMDTAPPRTEMRQVRGNRLQGDTIEDYTTPILNRNLFGPRNNPPQLASISRQRAYTGRSVSFTAKSSDRDKLDKVTIKLADGAPEGASIVASSSGEGKFSWPGGKPGEYEVTVIAYDDGYPSKTDRKMVSIVVEDPPPPKPVVKREDPKPTGPPPLRFDVARFTVLTSIVKSIDGRMQIWLFQQPLDKMLKLSAGDKFDIGSMKGVVESIEVQHAVLDTGKDRWLISVDEPMTEATRLPVDEF